MQFIVTLLKAVVNERVSSGQSYEVISEFGIEAVNEADAAWQASEFAESEGENIFYTVFLADQTD